MHSGNNNMQGILMQQQAANSVGNGGNSSQ